jgi:hypothetical protein
MGAPVVVHGLPVAGDWRAAALSACSEASKRACLAAEDLESGAAAPSISATITAVEGSERRVRIVLERAGDSRVTSREPRFAAEDPPVERWRATGLVIAALVGESEAPGAESPNLDERRFAAPFRSMETSAGWVALAANGGPGLDDGSARFGGSLHGAIALGEGPLFFAASAGRAWRPAGDSRVGVTWTTLSAGSGLRTWFARGDVEVRARLELLGEYISASSAAAALRGGGHRLLPGLRAGADAVWPARGVLGVTAGFSVWSLSGGTAITLDEQKVGSSPWLSYAGWLGAQWAFR